MGYFLSASFLHNSPNLEATQIVIHRGNGSVCVFMFLENYYPEIQYSYRGRKVNNGGTQRHKFTHSIPGKKQQNQDHVTPLIRSSARPALTT